MSKARILVVDDERAVRGTIERALRNAGYEVAAASDTDAAYELLAESRFDAIILDIRVPTVPGDAFYLAAVKRWPELRGRVLLMSGDLSCAEGWPADLAACTRLEKPFSLTVLTSAVAQLVDRPNAPSRRHSANE